MIGAMQKTKRKKTKSENFERLSRKITWTEPTNGVEHSQESLSEKRKVVYSSQGHFSKS